MANPSVPYFGIWRLFIDESRTKINDFYEIDCINTFGASALDQITGRYMQKNGNYGYIAVIHNFERIIEMGNIQKIYV